MNDEIHRVHRKNRQKTVDSLKILDPIAHLISLQSPNLYIVYLHV